ncbi:hypothetical protein [uncultured Microbacterium sp.]|uniref:hypothetical protein n=1 Tax=uncultured Microbacterium sp. TaxID=191216 RepID=UPI0025D5E637|nr:hypothetical protein [uncultured Microbacterium sp.]
MLAAANEGVGEKTVGITHIQLTHATTRSQLRDAHETLAALDADATVALHLGSGLRPRTPSQFSAWTQLVLTWGQDFASTELHLTGDTVTRACDASALSDIEVLAITLAASIYGPGSEDVADELRVAVRAVLEQRDLLTEHTGDGDDPSWSLLLASHTFSNRTSPELHASWDGKLAIEETARTLYHDVWPSSTPPYALRPALAEFGEMALPAGSPTRVIRGSEDSPYLTLGRRAPQPRGLAYDLATAVRQQPKPLHDEMGEILFELVQNTQWHATKYPGGRTGANCRLIHFHEFSFTREQLREAEGFDPHFVAYVRTVANFALKRQKHIDHVRFGAMTIVDSGAGLARSVALSLEEEHLLDPTTEIGYLIKALNKSLKVRRADMGNIGLTRVQQSLTNLRGYMSIRTGTVEIRRDFASNPFEQISEVAGAIPPALFLDWVPKKPEDFYVGPRLGTAVTVAYPVDLEGRS